MPESPAGVIALSTELAKLGWVSELFVGGSAATGDYRPGISDLDLVALTTGPVSKDRRGELQRIHRALDRGAACGMKLGCAYVESAGLLDVDARHPTWTHGAMVVRPLSPVARAELVRYGYAMLGKEPQALMPSVSDDDIRSAARAELAGYWTRAAARPWWWLNHFMVDLSLTSMARGRHALTTGQLLTKTAAIEAADAPSWLVDQMRARRRGESSRSPRLRSAWYAWCDARRTTAQVRCD